MTEFDLFPGQAGGGRGSEHTRKHQFGWFSFLFLFFCILVSIPHVLLGWRTEEQAKKKNKQKQMEITIK